MAISTYKTYLLVKSSSTYAKLVDIKNFPDLGSEPDMIDITTLSDGFRHYLLGIQDTGALNFDFNADSTSMATVNAACDGSTEKNFAVAFGSETVSGTGAADMVFYFKGVGKSFITGGGVNEAVNGRITIGLTSDIGTSEPA